MPEEISDAELMRRFCGVGFNCEFGFAQRYCGAEPLDLFRWAGTPASVLVSLLDNDFAGIGEGLTLKMVPSSKQYLIVNGRYGFEWHAWVQEGEMTPDALIRRESLRLPRVADFFRETLRDAGRIFVRIPMPSENEAHCRRILQALRQWGDATLLFVEEEPDKAGSVDVVEPNLLRGSISAHSHTIVQNVCTSEWLTICRNALFAAHCRYAAAPL